MLNSFHGMGYLGNDPVIKQDKTGKDMTSFVVMIPRDFKGGKKYPTYDFVHCKAWKNIAHLICNYFSKRQVIVFTGRWTCVKKGGEPAPAPYLTVERVYFPHETKNPKSEYESLAKIPLEEIADMLRGDEDV